MQKPEPTETSQARRFTDTVERYSTVIGPSITIRGDLSGGDAVDVAGTLEGDSRVEAHFRVREGARVAGRIEATSLVVAGEVSAPELVADKIEVGTAGRVKANLDARVVAIAEGAIFDGRVHMRGSDAGSGPITFKEQRKPRAPGESPQG